MKKIVVLFIAFSFFSCEKKDLKKPTDLISKEQMANLLFDLHVSNKTMNIKNTSKEKNINYSGIIFEKYKIDSTRFKTSHAYYIYNINKYREIYKIIETRLDTLVKKQEEANKIADSIKKLSKKKLKLEKPKLELSVKNSILKKKKMKKSSKK